MGPRHYRRSTDKNEAPIVAALKAAGWKVWKIAEPVDLLVKKHGIIGTIEVKNPHGRDRLQDSQIDHLDGGGNCGVVRSIEDALALVATFKPLSQSP